VRELENAIEGLVALSPPDGLDLTLLPGGGGVPRADGPGAHPLKEKVEAYERGLVVEALRASRGNRTEAARALGISRVTLHDKLKKYGLGAGADEEPR
jgi:DNA-binding NtrC family response regulator